MKLMLRKFNLALFVLTVFTVPALAGSAQWNLVPGSGDWNTNTNWTPATGFPNGSADTATFGLSNTVGVSISANTEVNSIVFNSGANAFTIAASPTFTLTISGAGITNNSGVTQNFFTPVNGAGNHGTIMFTNSATVGSMTAFTNNGGAVSGGSGGATFFLDSSNAGNGVFTNNGGAVSGAGGGATVFQDGSTAGSGTFTSNGGAVSGALGGQTNFFSTATAGSATLIATGMSGGGGTGLILFNDDSTGGTARVEVFGNGNLDISLHNATGVTIGSVEGTGDVFLGARSLSVGSNNLSTSFSGVIQDGGLNLGTGGSLTKIGAGTLTLSGANTYTGGTTISAGTLLVNNSTGSGTGSGAVGVNSGGTLAGIGFISGPVAVNSGGAISPGQSPGTLTINNTLTLNSNATFKFELNSSTAAADKVVAKGVTINDANFSFTDLGSGVLTPGTVFIVIDNTSSSSINGFFINLGDGSTFTSNGNTYQISYEGGTGNDLTLAVVPEPTTYSFFILGATLLIFARKRRTSN